MKKLTARELEIMSYAANGYTAKEIGKKVGLKYRTIETYIISLKRKLEAKNIAHAIYLACKLNLLTTFVHS